MDNNEIKKANRKAMPKFLLLVAVSAAFGGTVGYLSARYGLNSLSGGIKVSAEAFGMHIAPWLLLAVAVILPLICIPLYKKAKNLLSLWDGEDEAVSDEVDSRLSLILWITGTGFIVSCFLITAVYSVGFDIFEGEDKSFALKLFGLSIAAFVLVLIEFIIIQQKCVDTAKRTNPEKNVSVYDMKFQKKWMDSCDEAEKLVIGKCAFKAYNAASSCCLAV